MYPILSCHDLVCNLATIRAVGVTCGPFRLNGLAEGGQGALGRQGGQVSQAWQADGEQGTANERSGDASGDVAVDTPVSLLRPLSSGL